MRLRRENSEPSERDPEERVGFFRGEARPPVPVIVAFIDSYKRWFGVERICRVLTEHGMKIAPSTYYAARSRPRSARTALTAT